MNNNDTDNPSVTVLAEAGGVALVRVEGNVRFETRQPYNVAGKLTHTLAAAPAKLTIVNLCCQTTLQYDHLAFTTCRYDLHARTCVNTTPRGGSLTAPPQLFAHFYDRLEAIQSILRDAQRRGRVCARFARRDSRSGAPRARVRSPPRSAPQRDRVSSSFSSKRRKTAWRSRPTRWACCARRLRGGDGYSHEDVVGLFSCPSSIPIVVGPPMKKETRSDQSSFLQMLFGAHVISSSTSHASRELTIRLPSVALHLKRTYQVHRRERRGFRRFGRCRARQRRTRSTFAWARPSRKTGSGNYPAGSPHQRCRTGAKRVSQLSRAKPTMCLSMSSAPSRAPSRISFRTRTPFMR